MTWEETIIDIRKQEKYADLVRLAYFDEDLEKNLVNYKNSEEFEEIINYINKYKPNTKKILDVGSGNGISAVAFALKGFEVTAIEPDASTTVGAGAIQILKDKYKLKNLTVIQSFAEEADLELGYYDIVFCRQSLHHAIELDLFVSNLSKHLKKGGLFFSVRDHVIYSEVDKQLFLSTHPLHKFYGGENAFKRTEYLNAFKSAKLKVLEELRHYDSPINYFPETRDEVKEKKTELNGLVKSRLGLLRFIPFIKSKYVEHTGILDERKIPGRLYSYILLRS